MQCSRLAEKANAVENVSQPGHEITMRLCDLIMLTHRASSSSSPFGLYKGILSLPLTLFLFFLAHSLPPLLSSLIDCDRVCLALAFSIHADNLISVILLPQQLVKALLSETKTLLGN